MLHTCAREGAKALLGPSLLSFGLDTGIDGYLPEKRKFSVAFLLIFWTFFSDFAEVLPDKRLGPIFVLFRFGIRKDEEKETQSTYKCSGENKRSWDNTHLKGHKTRYDNSNYR